MDAVTTIFFSCTIFENIGGSVPRLCKKMNSTTPGTTSTATATAVMPLLLVSIIKELLVLATLLIDTERLVLKWTMETKATLMGLETKIVRITVMVTRMAILTTITTTVPRNESINRKRYKIGTSHFPNNIWLR